MKKISDGEYQARIAAAQEKMAANGIDAIIAHSHEADFANVRYFSNYWPLFETGGIFIPKEGEPTLIIGPESETFAAGRSKIQNIAKILEYRESAEPAYPGIALDTFESIAETYGGLSEFKKIGICGFSLLSVPIYQAIIEAFPDAEVFNSKLVSELRQIKSPAEIEILKEAFEISEKVLEQVIPFIKPGMTETQVVGHIQKYIYQFGGEYEAHPVYVLSGPNSNNAIGRPTGRVIRKGDMVQINLGARIDGYSPSIGRPIVMGRATDEMRKLLLVGLEAHFKTYEWLRNGVAANEVVDKFYNFIVAQGCGDNYLYGPAHGLGMMEVEQPWVEANSEYRFVPNMTFQVDTFLAAADFGLRWENGIHVTEDGCAMLSKYKTELIEIS
ncbi:MAG: M24 family metallopeptidase [Desulfobacterales bacterium]